jgi:hypothetical protein
MARKSSKLDTSRWRQDLSRRDLVDIPEPRLEFVAASVTLGSLFNGDSPRHTICNLEEGTAVMVVAKTMQYNNFVKVVLIPDGRMGWLFSVECEER